MHDVVVVGAGPAGSIAALRLSRAGARVLLLERAALGRDKPCGGGLTPRAWHGLEVPIGDLVFGVSDTVEVRRGTRAVQVPLGDRPVQMVRRRDFDERLATAAASAGAELHEREAVTAVEADDRGTWVRCGATTYAAGAVLIATGAEGSLGAGAGLARAPARMAAALEIEAPADAPRLNPAHIVFDYGIRGGYAWAFAKGGIWNVGVLSTRRAVGPRLRSLLAAFIDAAGITFADAQPRVRGHRIPMQRRWHRLAAGRVALIGDAAGLADPFYGEGIAQAMVSGRCAADAVLALLAGRSADLIQYEHALRASVGAHQRRMRLVARAVYPAPALAMRLLARRGPRSVARRWAVEPFRLLESAA